MGIEEGKIAEGFWPEAESGEVTERFARRAFRLAVPLL